MPKYQCRFLDESEKTVRAEVLAASDDLDAHREAMTLLMRVGRFSGYELWDEGRKVEGYQPAKESKSSSPR
jgi:hypothetical protein